jgi:hypothetical protein
VPERFLLLRTAKQLSNDSVVLELNSSLGGRSAIMARGNKHMAIHTIEAFNEGSLINEFDSVKPWIREQLFDMCKDNNLDRKVGQELFENLTKDFEMDPSGKLAWKRITGNYSNITLHERASTKFTNWATPLDMIVINMRNNPTLNRNISHWVDYLKDDGRIMVHLYEDKDSPDVTKEINNLISQGWKIVDRADTMVLIQRS